MSNKLEREIHQRLVEQHEQWRRHLLNGKRRSGQVEEKIALRNGQIVRQQSVHYPNKDPPVVWDTQTLPAATALNSNRPILTPHKKKYRSIPEDHPVHGPAKPGPVTLNVGPSKQSDAWGVRVNGGLPRNQRPGYDY